ncbi:ABC transporter ATP-binding protein [Spirochaeta isovalerica]|uniref:ABC-2 type transport system ATP-binding protein n=1 Tax=Spirochaeta isovalerica TaxID=150 RepID=A0A841R9B8_9SPIO|nr:ABC transporter ATP-binding protein [Spirochaeta isovalerica]MBB6479620.1 ABC-2 type transport system ATP-binding protein [Spirochaeta isovalerica]
MAAKEHTSFIRIKGIEKEYPVPNLNPFRKGERQKALKGLDLTIPRGSVCCVLGPNGAGKTTLIKILAGLILPDKGSIEIPEKDFRGVGLVTPNDRSFYWRLTGRQNLDFFASLYGISDRDETINSVLKEVNLYEDADKPFRQYSAGMKQKLNIARALLSDPDLYLLDEPANHLDPIAREDFRNFVREILLDKRGATVFLCTHDLDEAAELADRIALLHKGRIVAEGDPQILRNRVQQENHFRVRHESLPSSWQKSQKEKIEIINDWEFRLKSGIEEISSLMEDFIRSGGRLIELKKEEPGLMDILKHFLEGPDE